MPTLTCPSCREICTLNSGADGFVRCTNCGAEFNEATHEFRNVTEAGKSRIRTTWNVPPQQNEPEEEIIEPRRVA